MIYVFEYTSKDILRWLDREGEKALRRIGIKSGQTVLDFGCGSGNYTLPTARIVGEKGKVYALDKDVGALDELMRKAELKALKNISRINTSGEVEIGLEKESIDTALLYDIFWYFPLTDGRLSRLLAEIYRISRNDALISVYPQHIDSERLTDKMESAGFHLKDKYFGVLIHDGKLENGQVLNFVKKVKKR
jgi:ubiquinone/menaquinone biosynthesis C-methylase UbiE